MTEVTYDELTTIPIPLVTQGKEVGEVGSEVKPGKKGGWGEDVFNVKFLFLITVLYFW